MDFSNWLGLSGIRKKPEYPLEEVNQMAINHGFKSYGEFRAALQCHNMTVKQFKLNGEKFKPVKHKIPNGYLNYAEKQALKEE